MSFEQQPYDNTIWPIFSWRMRMNQFILVCVETLESSVQEISALPLVSEWSAQAPRIEFVEIIFVLVLARQVALVY